MAENKKTGRGTPVLMASLAKLDVQALTKGIRKTNTRIIVEFDRVRMFDTFVRCTMDAATVNKMSEFWITHMSEHEKKYILKKANEQVSGIVRLKSDGTVEMENDQDCPYDALAFILAFATEKTRKTLFDILIKEERQENYVKGYQVLTEKMPEGSIDLVYLCDLNYFAMSHKTISISDMTGIVDPMDFQDQLSASKIIFSIVAMRYIYDQNAIAFITDEAYVKPVFYQLYLEYVRTWHDTELYFSIAGMDTGKLIRFAERRMSAFHNVEDAFVRCIDIYHFVLLPDLADKISKDIISRMEKKQEVSPLLSTCYSKVETAMKEYAESFEELRDDYCEMAAELDQYRLDRFAVLTKAARLEEEIAEAVAEETKVLRVQLEQAQKDLKTAKSESDRLRAQSNNYQSYIKEQKEDLEDLRAEVEDLSSRLDDADEKIAVREEQAVPEQERKRMETDDPLPEDLELLAATRVVVIGGHNNFHHQLLDQMPEWRCVQVNKNTDTETLVAHADLIVFMTNHMSHSMFEKNKQFCYNKGVPFVSLCSNNVSRCLNRIAKEIRVIGG